MRLLTIVIGMPTIEAQEIIRNHQLQPFILAEDGNSVPQPAQTTPRQVLLTIEKGVVIQATLN